MNPSGPKILLHLEGLVVLVAACIFYHELGASWVKFAVFFLAPDIFMVGYFFGRKFGALLYNSVHTYIGPVLLWLVLYFTQQPTLMPFCAIWIAHIGFDRLWGYGLKYNSGFKDTHFSRI